MNSVFFFVCFFYFLPTTSSSEKQGQKQSIYFIRRLHRLFFYCMKTSRYDFPRTVSSAAASVSRSYKSDAFHKILGSRLQNKIWLIRIMVTAGEETARGFKLRAGVLFICLRSRSLSRPTLYVTIAQIPCTESHSWNLLAEQ